jgi:response regulator RpfG family c-di-GMP phosphodiesterase
MASKLRSIRVEMPDALVSDVMLPRMDGFALCRRLREDPTFIYLPVYLHSFRVEGPKYEAFAAEVGAQRFLPRGSKLEDLATSLDDAGAGSGTVRIPALCQLLDRVKDCRRLLDTERHVRELEATNQQLTVAERVARERAEHEARARAEFATAESVRIRELLTRIKDLEAAQKGVADAETRRGAVEETSRRPTRCAETRLIDFRSPRTRNRSR